MKTHSLTEHVQHVILYLKTFITEYRYILIICMQRAHFNKNIFKKPYLLFH